MKYTVHAVDRAGIPWEVCQTNHKDSLFEIVDALQNFKGRYYFTSYTDDPERGQVHEDDI